MLLRPQAERAAVGFRPPPRFIGLCKGHVAAASCISKVDCTASFLWAFPSFFPLEVSRSGFLSTAPPRFFPRQQGTVGKPRMRGQATLCHHHVIFSWAFHSTGSSAGYTGSTHPSLQGRSRSPYLCNARRGSLENRFRDSVAVFTLNECLLNWIISLLQICNVHLHLPHFLWGWQLTLESDRFCNLHGNHGFRQDYQLVLKPKVVYHQGNGQQNYGLFIQWNNTTMWGNLSTHNSMLVSHG